MSYDVHLYVRGEFTTAELASLLQPHFSEPLTPAKNHDGTIYWGSTYDGMFTCVGHNIFEDDDYDPGRYPIVIIFYALYFGEISERNTWLDRTWRQWWPWLTEAGAEELLLVPNLGYPFRHWSLLHAASP